MTRAYDERLQARRAQLFSAGQLLGAMSYRGVLSRGFALVRDETQKPLWRADDVRQAQRLEIEFADGKIGAIAGGRVGPPLTPPALLPRRRVKIGQGLGGAGVAVLSGSVANITKVYRSLLQINPSKPKEIQGKRLGFPWIPLADLGLFNGLRRIQIKKFFPLFFRPAAERLALLSGACCLPRRKQI